MKREYGLIVAPPAVILKESEPQQFSIESLPKQLFQNSVLLFTFATEHLLFSSSPHVSYRYSIHKNTKYTEQADSCDQPQFVSVYEHLLLPSISMSIYINVG